MNIDALEFAIVIVANDCNPTILNPDFLARQYIVPDEWGWKVAGPAITTPPFALVNYDSGVRVSVEQNKSQVADFLPERTPEASKAPEIARKYVEVLPHVRYEAVGHNIKGFVEQADAESFIRSHFLKPDLWHTNRYPLQKTRLYFVYSLPGALLNLSLSAASIMNRSGAEPENLNGLLVEANYHRECEGYPSYTQVVDHLDHVSHDWSHFQDIAPDILG